MLLSKNRNRDIIYQNNSHYLYLYKLMWHLVSFLLKMIAPYFRKGRKLIVFHSRPDFSDNSRAFSDYLINNGYTKRYQIVWMLESPQKHKRIFKTSTSDIKFVSCMNKFHTLSLRSLWILYRADYIMGTHGFLLEYSLKKHYQQFILLWHGCSFKNSSPNGIHRRFFDKALVPGDFFIKLKAKYWKTDNKYFIAKGYPRYDWLLNQSESALKFVGNYTKGKQKLIIWMPTFRNDKNGKYNECNGLTNFPILSSLDDWVEIDNLCVEKNVCLFVKLHQFQKDYGFEFSSMHNIKSLTSEDLRNAELDLYEFLSITDGLITDYSSVGVDYLIVDKPIAYTLDDFQQYKESRGFLVEEPLNYMVGHHLYDLNDLKQFIIDIGNDNDAYRSRRREVASSLIFKSDRYSELLAEELGL